MSRRKQPTDCLITESAAMQRVADAVNALADTDEPVLICGEQGTGRGLVGRLLHGAGKRHGSALVELRAHMAAPDWDPATWRCGDVLARGQGGTVLIRDLGNVPRAQQAELADKLMIEGATRGERAPARGQVVAGGDAVPGSIGWQGRLVSTCEPELLLAAEQGFFHPRLFAALSVRVIQVPSLRERREDIPRLFSELVRWYATELGRGRMTISSRVVERLCSYSWPGNTTELKRVVRRVVVRAAGSRIEADELDTVLPILAERMPAEALSFEDVVRSKLTEFLRRVDGYPLGRLYDDVISWVERPLLGLLMEHTGGNQVRAAEILGMNRNTLRRKLNQRGLLVRTKAGSRTKTTNNTVRTTSREESASRALPTSRRAG